MSTPHLKTFNIPFKSKKTILALSAESAGNFSVFTSSPLIKGAGGIFFSDDFGDLLDEKNFKKFQKAVLNFLKNNKIHPVKSAKGGAKQFNGIKPAIILTDLHPLYKTTIWGAELAKKYKAKHIQVQHHIAHIFSAVGENMLNSKFKILNPKQIQSRIVLRDKIQNSFFGIALDGTGYGLDGKIWGGEIFRFKISDLRFQIERIGHLENQVMIGGDWAIREPARMLISILNKLTTYNLQLTTFQRKDFIYKLVKKYYSRNQFELLYNQLQQNFNCQETSSTGRILDAVSVLLGFCGNERKYKHEPIDLLEKNSTKPYKIPPLIKGDRGIYTLQTTYLFEYLIKNLHRDKRRLAATAQLYIAKGLYKIYQMSNIKCQIFIGGGIANNKIISNYFESRSAIANKKIYPVKSKFNGVPRGDAGISFGQVIYYLLILNKKIRSSYLSTPFIALLLTFSAFLDF